MPRSRDSGGYRGPTRWYILSRETIFAYFKDQVPRLGAALAFYTTVALTPLLMLVFALAGILFEGNDFHRRILREISDLAGPDATRTLESVKAPAHLHSAGAWFGIIIFIAGGFGVFSNFQASLNHIWRAPVRVNEPFLQTLKRQAISIGAVVFTGFTMLFSLLLSSVITWIAEHTAHFHRWPPFLTEGGNFVVSLGIIAVLLALLFKMLPDVQIRWQDVWTGAIFTALLFEIGKTALAFYFAHSQVTSVYGATGSVIALLLWCYYAAQIIFLGAELTRIYAVTEGGRFDLPEGDVGFPANEAAIAAQRASELHRR